MSSTDIVNEVKWKMFTIKLNKQMEDTSVHAYLASWILELEKNRNLSAPVEEKY